ncbi:MAG: hypothetical protein IK095_09220 [Oscillospiraceae bacterium]|nr:hypothetical protein [Oscillospiraceae bacterium]
MKEKTTVWIVVAMAVLALVVVLLVWKPFGAAPDAQDGTGEIAAVSDDAQKGADGVAAPVNGGNDADAQAEETAETGEEETISQAQLIENEGEIEIIIPDDQDSDGF